MLRRFLIFVHRWLGVALCLVFLLWFPSGIVMMYWGFPEVTPADRLRRAAPLDPSTITVSPADAFAALGRSNDAGPVRLNTFDGRPVYRFRGPGEALVYADTGERQTTTSDGMRMRIAATWSGQSPSSARVEPVIAIDQWTVSGGLRNIRPLWKYSWPDGQQVYVSGATGEVVQYTTRASRIAAYLGAIPHWLYFTPLRTHELAWSRVVIWSSGIATVSALLGIVIGIWMYSPRKRYRASGAAASIPYTGQKRWHMIFGLIVGLGAVTWAFSGMLSMDPFPLAAETPRAGGGIAQTLRGRPRLKDFNAKGPSEALRELGVSVKELEFVMFDGEPVYIATLAGGSSQIVPVIGNASEMLDEQRIIAAIRRGARPNSVTELKRLDRYDAYYLDRRHESPLPVMMAKLDDAERTRYYIDIRTGRIVGGYGSRDWITRWAYHGLHSLDFPWLYAYRPAWDLVVLFFMIGGTALTVTSVVLAWQVLGRTLRAA